MNYLQSDPMVKASVHILLQINHKQNEILNHLIKYTIILAYSKNSPPQVSINSTSESSLFIKIMDIESFSLPARKRGSYSEKFKPLDILTNYYSVKLGKMDKIHIFSVKFNPQVPADNIPKRLGLLREALPKLNFIQNPIITASNIYSLTPPIKTQNEVEVQSYKIAVKIVKVLQVNNNPQVLLTFLNVAFRNVMKRLNFTQLGKSRKFFNTTRYETPDPALKLFSGYQANFLLADKGIYLRVDPAKKIVRKERVLDAINTVYAEHKEKDRQEKRNCVREAFVGKTVMTNYGKARYIRIDDILFENVDTQCLPGTETTLRKFYEEKYSIKIENARQPLLVVKDKRKPEPDLMVPQLCLMTGIPDSFDEFKRKKISESTIKSPAEKKKEIDTLIKDVSTDNHLKSLKQLGIDLSFQMEKIKAKSIQNPILQLGQGKTIEKGKQAGFQLFANPIFGSKYDIKLGIIHTARANVRDVLRTFESTSMKLKVKLDTKCYNLGDVDPRKSLQAILCNAEHADKDGCNLLFIVIPNILKTQYKKIKDFCLFKIKKVTQCATQGTLSKKNVQSIATKILLQIIAKKGNILWVPTLPKQVQNVMIVAFDNASVGGKSVVTMCCTVNSTFSSVFTLNQKFSSNDEKLRKMTNLLCKGIEYYCERNKKSPSEVIIFHNACTGDQNKLFYEYFIEPSLKRLKEESKTSHPPCLTMVMVNTKTNERFFSQGHNNEVRNVGAGTLVSTDIVSPEYDFYMVSQFSNKGSTVPNHYKIIYSDSKIEEGLIQEVVFSQCFNYVNWTGSIKVPGILQYAKKACKFNSEVLEGEDVEKELCTKLYFV